jgi:alkyl hydroperoxide reductase subunit AhpF
VVLSAQIEEQLRKRFADSLQGTVRLTVHVRTSASSRLILSGGAAAGGSSGEVREMCEQVAACADGKVTVEVVEVPLGGDDGYLPRIEVAPEGAAPRIEYRGLPAGYEFAVLVDAIERCSTGPGLSEASIEKLAGLEAELEVMVFGTPG